MGQREGALFPVMRFSLRHGFCSSVPVAMAASRQGVMVVRHAEGVRIEFSNPFIKLPNTDLLSVLFNAVEDDVRELREPCRRFGTAGTYRIATAFKRAAKRGTERRIAQRYLLDGLFHRARSR